jgi:uncharacterized membrane-anchored protein YhcB (DUF1043 family)
MENLQLIMVTVLITLISGALVGSLIYLGVVVRKLRRTVKDNVVDITNLQNALNGEMQNVHGRIDIVSKETDDKLKELSDCWNHNSSEMDRKIDSRYDKLSSNMSNCYDDLLRKVNTTETNLLNKILVLEEVKTK